MLDSRDYRAGIRNRTNMEIQMTSLNINPLGMIVNLIIGWFVISFLQAILRAILSSDGLGLWARFLDIALFRQGPAILINVIVIVVFGGIGTALWFMARK
jgi:hypothetical protein